MSKQIKWIKQALGKLEISADFYPVIKDQEFELFSITPDHAYAAGSLPMHQHDPFDRMIIAQDRLENCVSSPATTYSAVTMFPFLSNG